MARRRGEVGLSLSLAGVSFCQLMVFLEPQDKGAVSRYSSWQAAAADGSGLSCPQAAPVTCVISTVVQLQNKLIQLVDLAEG